MVEENYKPADWLGSIMGETPGHPFPENENQEGYEDAMSKLLQRLGPRGLLEYRVAWQG